MSHNNHNIIKLRRGTAARAALIAYGWTITDGGLAP
jgi:hypothetical protein